MATGLGATGSGFPAYQDPATSLSSGSYTEHEQSFTVADVAGENTFLLSFDPVDKRYCEIFIDSGGTLSTPTQDDFELVGQSIVLDTAAAQNDVVTVRYRLPVAIVLADEAFLEFATVKTDPVGTDQIAGLDNDAPSNPYRKFNLSDLPVSDPTQAALDALDATKADQTAVDAAIDGSLSGYGATLQDDTPTGSIGGGSIVLEPDAATENLSLYRVEFNADAAGTGYVFVVTVSGSTATVIARQEFTLAAGFNALAVNIDVPTGAFLAFGGPSVVGTYGTGTVERQFGGTVSTQVGESVTLNASTITTVYGVNFHTAKAYENPARITTLETLVSEIDVSELSDAILIVGGVSDSFGFDGDIASQTPTGTLANSFNLLDPDATTADGSVTGVKVWVDEATTIYVRSYIKTESGAMTNGDTMTVRNSVEVDCAAGYNDIAVSVGFKIGDYVGVFVPSGDLQKLSSAGTNTTFFGGLSANLNEFTLSGNNQTQFLYQLDAVTVDTGLAPDVDQLQQDVTNLQTPNDAGAGYRIPALGALSGGSHLYVSVSGQSNAKGFSTPITTSAEYGAVGFSDRGTTVLPLGSDDVGGNEYPGFGLAAYLREQIMFGGGVSQSDASKIIVGRSALGGTAIADLDQGSAIYNDNQAQIAAAATYAGSNDFRHLGQAWFQGEKDAGNGTTRATYKSLLEGLASDFDTDSKVSASGAYDRPTFAMQMTSAVGYAGAAGWEIAMAQFEAGVDSDLVSLVGPCYHMPFVDDRHLTSEGYRVSGAMFARAMFSFAATGVLMEPLHVVEARISGNSVVLYYNRPDLELDVNLVPEQVDYGFKVNDGTSDVTINSVSVTRNAVTLECASAPQAGWSWSYGNIAATGLLPYYGGAGNIRDNAGTHDQIDGTPLHNWAVLQEGTI